MDARCARLGCTLPRLSARRLEDCGYPREWTFSGRIQEFGAVDFLLTGAVLLADPRLAGRSMNRVNCRSRGADLIHPAALGSRL